MQGLHCEDTWNNSVAISFIKYDSDEIRAAIIYRYIDICYSVSTSKKVFAQTTFPKSMLT